VACTGAPTTEVLGPSVTAACTGAATTEVLRSPITAGSAMEGWGGARVAYYSRLGAGRRRKALGHSLNERIRHADFSPTLHGGGTRLGIIRELAMHALLLAALAIAAFSATMTIGTTDANAVVCARGVVPHRANCSRVRRVAVVRRPVAGCRFVIVNGGRVRRCV
jgi:hypothetical protein